MNQNESNHKPLTGNLILISQEELEKINSKLDRLLMFNTGKENFSENHEWLTEQEVQKMLSKKTTSLWALRKSGKLKFSKIGQKNYYQKSDIINLLKRNHNHS